MYLGQLLANYGMEEALLLRQTWSLDSIPEEGREEVGIVVVVAAECLLSQSSLAGDLVGVGTGYDCCVRSSREEGREEVYTCRGLRGV